MKIGIWLDEQGDQETPFFTYQSAGENDPSKEVRGKQKEIQAVFGAIRSLQNYARWAANARGGELSPYI